MNPENIKAGQKVRVLRNTVGAYGQTEAGMQCKEGDVLTLNGGTIGGDPLFDACYPNGVPTVCFIPLDDVIEWPPPQCICTPRVKLLVGKCYCGAE